MRYDAISANQQHKNEINSAFKSSSYRRQDKQPTQKATLNNSEKKKDEHNGFRKEQNCSFWNKNRVLDNEQSTITCINVKLKMLSTLN